MNAIRITTILCFVLMSATTALGQGGPPLVVVAPVVKDKIDQGESFVGTVQPVRKSTVGSATDGRVISFPINAGDYIEKDKPLAQLRTGTVKIQLAAAKAELKLREIQRDETKALRPEELKEATARLEGAKAARDYAKQQLARTQRLYDRGTVTLDQLQNVTSLADRAEQTYLEAKAGNELVVRSQKLLKAQAEVEIKQEAVRQLEDRLDKHTIKAPFSGYIVTEHVEEGQWVSPGDAVAEIVDLSTAEVDAAVPQDFIAKLRRGADAMIEVDGLAGRQFTGTVQRIVPQADERARTFPVKIHVKNDDGALRANMLASILLGVGESVDALLVPKDALVLGGPTPAIFVADLGSNQQATVRQLTVRLGVARGDQIQVITDALRPGQYVVVQGNERLKDKAKVKVARKLPAPK